RRFRFLGRERRLESRPGQLAFPEPLQAYLPVDAPPVEPRAVKARAGLHRRIAPVDAHDDRVRACGELRARFKWQVGAPVRAGRAPIDPHARLEVRRAEGE